jgi:hypothetical protein
MIALGLVVDVHLPSQSYRSTFLIFIAKIRLA